MIHSLLQALVHHRTLQSFSGGVLNCPATSDAESWSGLCRLHSGKSKGLELLNESEPPTYDELYSGLCCALRCFECKQLIVCAASLTGD